MLTSAGGKNPSAVSNLVASLKLNGLTEEQAALASDKIAALAASGNAHRSHRAGHRARLGFAPKCCRGFSLHRLCSSASIRIGPDLANYGAHQVAGEHHLAASVCTRKRGARFRHAPFRYLFETKKIGATPSPDALNLPKEFAPADGYEVVAEAGSETSRGLSVEPARRRAVVYAPFTPPQISTNAPAK